ncbi:MAG: putative metal-binding motif-containing protein [Myxococcales bacterium]|nr:MAG: putative metal-binding motif-containing protein [Myxococcales bacterium]
MRYYILLALVLLMGCSAIIDADGSRFDDHLDAGADTGDTGTGTCDTDCDDGIACTDDVCVDGQCQNTANNNLCDAGFICVPASGGDGCVPDCDLDCSTPPNCPGNSCYDCNTAGYCNDTGTECIYTLRDEDGDGHYIETAGSTDCSGLDPLADDCEDNPANDGALINPEAKDICDGLDNNCDGSNDETTTSGLVCEGHDCSNPIPVVLQSGSFTHQGDLNSAYGNEYGQLTNSYLGLNCTEDGNGADVIYVLHVTGTADLEIHAQGVTDPDLDIALAILDDPICSTAAGDFGVCHDDIVYGQTGYSDSRIFLRAFGPISPETTRTLYILVKGFNSSVSGDYELTVTARTATGTVCGNDNSIIDISAGGLLYTQAGADNNQTGSCGSTGTEVVSRFSPGSSAGTGLGVLYANDVTGNFSPSLYLRSSSCTAGTELDCDTPGGGGGTASFIEYSVSSLESMNYAFVDAASDGDFVVLQHEPAIP